MDIESIQVAVTSAMQESRKRQHSRKEWTQNIKYKLVELAHANKFYACCSGVPSADWGEWLYDLVVLRYAGNSSNDVIESTELVVESEWDRDDVSILIDFQKLLLSNADIKLMVYYKNNTIRDTLEQLVRRYAKSNGTFLLAFLPGDDEDVVFYSIRGNDQESAR